MSGLVLFPGVNAPTPWSKVDNMGDVLPEGGVLAEGHQVLLVVKVGQSATANQVCPG